MSWFGTLDRILPSSYTLYTVHERNIGPGNEGPLTRGLEQAGLRVALVCICKFCISEAVVSTRYSQSAFALCGQGAAVI